MNAIFHFILNIIEFSYKKNLISNLKKNLPKKIKVFLISGLIMEKQLYGF